MVSLTAPSQAQRRAGVVAHPFIGKITATYRQGKSRRWSWRRWALRCADKLNFLKALSLRSLPHLMDRKAGKICQVGGPRAHKEVSSFALETAFRPFVGTGLIVAIANAEMVRDGEPEDSEYQVTSTDGESFDHRYAAASS